MDRKIEKKKWPPKKIAGIAAIVLFVSVVMYSLIFGDRSSKLNVHSEKITIAEVEKAAFQEYIPIVGEIAPIKTVYLDVIEGGSIDTIFIEDNTLVKKNDNILRLANTSLLMDIMWREAEVFQQENNLRSTRLALEQNRLTLRRTKLQLEYDIKQKKRAYERAEVLFKKNLISEEEFKIANDEYSYAEKSKELTIETQRQDSLFRQIQIKQLEENLTRMRSNLKIVKQRQDDLVIRAPVSGLLSSLNAEIGELKTPGTRLGQIDVLDGFRVRANIDEHWISRVEKGRHGTFPFAGNEYELIVDKVYLEVQDGRFEVDMEFVNEEPDGIRRGQTLHIRLELGDLEEAILLPRGGFYQKTGGQWVYVVDNSGSFAYKRKIKLGRQNPQVFEVLEGLQPGEEVITSSYDSYGDIDKLILK